MVILVIMLAYIKMLIHNFTNNNQIIDQMLFVKFTNSHGIKKYSDGAYIG